MGHKINFYKLFKIFSVSCCLGKNETKKNKHMGINKSVSMRFYTHKTIKKNFDSGKAVRGSLALTRSVEGKLMVGAQMSSCPPSPAFSNQTSSSLSGLFLEPPKTLSDTLPVVAPPLLVKVLPVLPSAHPTFAPQFHS